MPVNKAILIGRLGKDPELRYTPGEKAVCSFSVATTAKYKGGSSTTWHNIVAWEKQAEVIKEYFKKGDQIYIEGRIDNRDYEAKDGTKKYVSEVVVEKFEFIGGKKADNNPPPERGNKDDDETLPF